jgi:hypothetical protein
MRISVLVLSFFPMNFIYFVLLHTNEYFIWALIYLDTTTQTGLSANTVVPLFAAVWLVTLLCNREFASTNLDVKFV